MTLCNSDKGGMLIQQQYAGRLLPGSGMIWTVIMPFCKSKSWLNWAVKWYHYFVCIL